MQREQREREAQKQKVWTHREAFLKRAGLDPGLVADLKDIDEGRGSAIIRLGGLSGKYYNNIVKSRPFDEFHRPITSTKKDSKNVPDIAHQILTRKPKHSQDESKVEKGDVHAAGEEEGPADNHRIFGGYKEMAYGPPGLAAPISQVPQSEGRHKYFHYEGDWKEGKMDGFGTYHFADDFTYTGVMRNDWPCHNGLSVYKCGSAYEGDWKDGFFHGYGSLTSASGIKYTGAWKRGRRDGEGRLDYPSGSYYEGDFRDGKPNGRGTLVSKQSNVRFSGRWVDGFLRGYGTLTLPDGSEHVRHWPTLNRFGGGVGIRDAVEMIDSELNVQYLYRLAERDEVYGEAAAIELHHLLLTARKEIAAERAGVKAEKRGQAAKAKKEARNRAIEARKARLARNGDDDEEPLATKLPNLEASYSGHGDGVDDSFELAALEYEN